MRAFAAFSKKEVMENARNYRLLIMLCVFFVFGATSPLFAKFTPQILEAVAPNLSGAFGDPSAMDSWTQFHKNVSSLGLLLTVIIFSGSLSGEYSKGSLTILLAKGLPRRDVLLSKASVMAAILTVSYWLSFGIAYAYTAYLWPGPGNSLPHVFFAAFAAWVAGLLYLCILILGCVLFRQAFAAIIFFFAIRLVMELWGNIEAVAGYSPSFLVSKNVELLSGAASASNFVAPLIVAIAMGAAALAVSVFVFERKQL
jgi:ABC-2 type transport system permease protein